jgi:hypothetical protein
MAKALLPLRWTAILSFWVWGAVGIALNGSTLPVPLSGSNDWANAGVVMTASAVKVVSNFVMLFLLWLRVEILWGFREDVRRQLAANGAAITGHTQEETIKTSEKFPAIDDCRPVSDNVFMKQD